VVLRTRRILPRALSLRGYGITLLIPFRPDTEYRVKVWEWLRRYWWYELPAAEMVIGEDASVPFSKTAAVNRAFAESNGRIIVILDADCYLPGNVILHCARHIRRAQSLKQKLWYIPYRRFYRLTEQATEQVLNSGQGSPLWFGDPPPAWATEETRNSNYGHWFGALIQIMPAEAFIAAGGMDERFHGWGGEDISFMTAVDTLYAPHRTTPNGVQHLWHPHLGTEHFERVWEGQGEPGGNNELSVRYAEARARSARMYRLTREPGTGDVPYRSLGFPRLLEV
jgi:hypothetical protein